MPFDVPHDGFFLVAIKVVVHLGKREQLPSASNRSDSLGVRPAMSFNSVGFEFSPGLYFGIASMRALHQWKDALKIG